MTYFQIVTSNSEGTIEREFDFQTMEFAIANAAFMALATNGRNEDVLMYMVGPTYKALIADKAQVLDMQRQSKLAAMTDPGRGPNFRM